MKKTLAILAMLAAGMAAFAQNKNAIAVPEPKGVNLSEDTKWITLFIQGLITSNFQQYSGLTVIDRQNADMVKAEQRLSESAEFDEKNTVELGKMTNARLTVTGNIMAKSGAYALTFNITDVQTGETKASASVPNCLRSALEDGTAANQISYDLMTGFGITLSNDARKNLTQKAGVMTAATSAQVSVAKGIAAEQSGSNIEALTYYIQARKRDNKLAEATSRMATMTQVISSGNFGTNLKNMIKLRDDWDKLLTEVAETIATYVPAFTVFYYSDVRAEPLTNKNYNDKTVTFSVKRPDTFLLENRDELEDYVQLVQNVRKAVLSVPEVKNWGEKFTDFPWQQTRGVSRYNWPGYSNKSNGGSFEYEFDIHLLDKNKKEVASRTSEIRLGSNYYTTSNFGLTVWIELKNSRDKERIYLDVPMAYADSDTFYVTMDVKPAYSNIPEPLKKCIFVQPLETMTEEQRAKLDKWKRSTVRSLNISDGISVITKEMMRGYINIKDLTIPMSVKRIEEDAFQDCASLEEIRYYGKENSFKKISHKFKYNSKGKSWNPTSANPNHNIYFGEIILPDGRPLNVVCLNN